MSRLNKTADTLYNDGAGQDYGHYYPIENNSPANERPMKSDQQTQKDINENTKYIQDDRRVQYRVDSDKHNDTPRDQLYDIDPNEGVEKPKTNRIRVRLNPEKALDQHKQRSYQNHVTPPIRTETDPGEKSYELPNGNNPREDEVEAFSAAAADTEARIQSEHEDNISTPEGRYLPTGVAELALTLGSKVAHAEEGLKGEVVFANDHRVTVKWNDMTRERFSRKEASTYLTYVDDIEDQVDPLGEPSIETPDGGLTRSSELNGEVDNILNQALAAMDAEGEDDGIVEDGNPNPAPKPVQETKSSNVDIEKAKLQRQVKQYQAKEIDAVKEHAAREVIDLMKMKGMIVDANAESEQMTAVLAMDDTGFEAFRKAIVATPTMKQAESPKLSSSEEEALAILHGSGGGSAGGGVRTAGSGRSLADLQDSRPAEGSNPFANLTGLTAPIQVPSNEASSGRGVIASELANIDWTVLTKQF